MSPPGRLYDALTVAYAAAQVVHRAAVIGVEKNLPSVAYGTVPRPRNNPTVVETRPTATAQEAESKGLSSNAETGFKIQPNTWTYIQPHSPVAQRLSQGTDSQASILNTSAAQLQDEPILTAKTRQDNFDYYEDTEPAVKLTPSRVPSSRLGRLFHYGSLAASLTAGTASEYVRRAARGSGADAGSPMMSEANVSRLVDKLSRMRGAALKLGQFLSIQDAHVLPEQIERVLRQVQNNAHYMPNSQLEQVLRAEFGPNWNEKFTHFDPIPIASASIGQVHKATIPPNDTPIALKVQFPNIAESIYSDLANISTLLTASALLPRGLYLDRTLAVMKGELADECDYEREATCIERFGEFLGGENERFRVPRVFRELTTKRALAMEWMEGVSVAKGARWPQRIRDRIATDILTLCLRELFEFRLMQTDPNWSNFLYNPRTDKLELIDFGASREYSKEFMDDWFKLLSAAVQEDRDACVEYSLKLGYLTGAESQEMIDAHVRSVTLLGVPFRASTPQPFSFKSQTITDEIRALIPVMLRLRLTPPPTETYSLNRKLSGAFLLCGRLGADVDCRSIWERVAGAYKLG
ncbi:putative ABC1-ubiquinol-cytochrome-C reductase complex assembly-like protein [Rhizoctonia solani 123E]|uniref:Putative ABC1-ubiquinol-cytochrome-C reductase complex assembly-like protein n=1 Tax=Rhizoctonia solani 123E TaxID=1423351 RepID=A0A074RJR6_9AGAM|nr:putative ABC1-ubiquinol-cytochrome-C reductase complex assembly-like protein [Rhizoctonia solani 123E]